MIFKRKRCNHIATVGLKPDIVVKQYLGRNEVFADIFNHLLYNGEEKIKAEQLSEMDTTALAVPYGLDEAGTAVQKYRDVLKCVAAKSDGDKAFLLLGIEGQTKEHYAMPVKNMLYDAMQYSGQVEQTKNSWKGHSLTGLTGAEYLSGFRKTDRLLPVITLVVYLNAEAWEGPRSLHEMLATKDETILQYVQDYKIHLITPADITKEAADKFKTDFGQVMRYIGKSKEEAALRKMMEEDERYQYMSRDAVNVLNAVTHSGIPIEGQEEMIDMCKAIEDMKKHSRAEGHAEGHAEGISVGRREHAKEVANALFKDGMNVERISQIIQFDVRDVANWVSVG